MEVKEKGKRKFKDFVESLFAEIVSDVRDEVTSAHDVLTLLQGKEMQPVKTVWEEGHLKLVYDNVTLDIAEHLDTLTISHTSDHTVTLSHLQHHDAGQLSEFVMALEREVARWEYRWSSEEVVMAKKALITKSIKKTLREIRRAWTSGNIEVTPALEQEYRFRYYNVKAKQMMLASHIPYWKYQRTVVGILEQFEVYQLVPPIELWHEEWTAFASACKKQLENKRNQQK